MNIYVSNFPNATTEDELREVFEVFGAVSTVAVIKDKFTGVARGFGFIEMPTKVEAKAAIAQLDGHEFNGRPLAVSEARPREERSGGASDRNGSRRST